MKCTNHVITVGPKSKDADRKVRPQDRDHLIVLDSSEMWDSTPVKDQAAPMILPTQIASHPTAILQFTHAKVSLPLSCLH